MRSFAIEPAAACCTTTPCISSPATPTSSTPHPHHRPRPHLHPSPPISTRPIPQMLRGMRANQKEARDLGDVADYRLLSASAGIQAEGKDDAHEWADTLGSMRAVGMSDEEASQVLITTTSPPPHHRTTTASLPHSQLNTASSAPHPGLIPASSPPNPSGRFSMSWRRCYIWARLSSRLMRRRSTVTIGRRSRTRRPLSWLRTCLSLTRCPHSSHTCF